MFYVGSLNRCFVDFYGHQSFALSNLGPDFLCGFCGGYFKLPTCRKVFEGHIRIGQECTAEVLVFSSQIFWI